MKRFGIYAVEAQPVDNKARRIFSFKDTWGDNKQILRSKIEKLLEEYDPVEIHVPNYVKKTQEFFDRWDMDLFYKEIRKFQNTVVTVKEGDTDNPIQRNDWLTYVGDVDTLIPCKGGNFLFIDEKTTTQALKENQTAHYVSLSQQTNQKVWYIIGPTPNPKDPNHRNVNYRLIEIEPNGEHQLFKGTLEDIFSYLYHWLEKSYDNPIIDELASRRKARQIMDSAVVEENYKPLSNKITYLDERSKYRAA